jgi:hypothetical protein
MEVSFPSTLHLGTVPLHLAAVGRPRIQAGKERERERE